MSKKVKHGSSSRYRFDSQAALLYPSKDSKGKATVRCLYPDEVIKCRNNEELNNLLEHYSKPDIDAVVSATKSSRLHYIQRIRPALRYYCAKFGTKVPNWLEGNGKWEDMDSQSKQKKFGVSSFRVLEFPVDYLGD